jgi:hypothetical protein
MPKQPTIDELRALKTKVEALPIEIRFCGECPWHSSDYGDCQHPIPNYGVHCPPWSIPEECPMSEAPFKHEGRTYKLRRGPLHDA